MSGHSKWANIKHKKAKEDARRAKLFTKLVREITVAARQGGGDPEMNISLRLAIDKAKDANMPKENIERAIKRGTGELEGVDLEEAIYEGYGPNGVAMMVHTVTDNKNRTVSELRGVFTKKGGTMAEAGAVEWQFERKGYISLLPDGVDEEDLFEIAVEAGAEDIEFGEKLIEIYSSLDQFESVQQALEDADISHETAELAMVPKTTVKLEKDKAFRVMKLIDTLEDLDDVQQVYSNLEISDELIAQYEEDN